MNRPCRYEIILLFGQVNFMIPSRSKFSTKFENILEKMAYISGSDWVIVMKFSGLIALVYMHISQE